MNGALIRETHAASNGSQMAAAWMAEKILSAHGGLKVSHGSHTM